MSPPIARKPEENPFSDMGIIKFWIVSSLFWICFPLSLLVSYLVVGRTKTKQLVAALIHDFLQTLLMLLGLLAVIIWAGYYIISGLF